MALSGTKSTLFAGGNFELILDWSATQNKSANTSTVTATLKIRGVHSYSTISDNSSSPTNITINGNNRKFNVPSSVGGGGTSTLGTHTVVVPHNADGTKSFTISANHYWDINWSSTGFQTPSVSIAVSLDRIYRAYGFLTNRQNFDMDTTATVLVTNNGTGYNARLYIYFGKKKVAINTNMPIGSNYNFTLKASDFADQIPTTTTGTGIFIVETWNGSTKIGESQSPLTLTIPPGEAYSPSVSDITLIEQSDTVKTVLGTLTDTFIQNKSVIRAGATASTAFESPIQTYKYEIGSLALTSTANTLDFDLGQTSNITNGTKQIKLTVTDRRGRSSSLTKEFNVLEYFNPVLSNFSISRVGNTATLQLNKAVKVSSLKNGTTEKNTYTVVTMYKKSTDTAWVTAKTETNTSVNFNLTGFATDSSYDITVTLTDKFTSVTVQGTVSTAKVPLDLHKDIGVGIGKLHEEGHGVLDVGGSIWTEGLVINGVQLIDIFYPIGTIYESTNSSNPSNTMGGTWERFGDGRVLVGVDETDSSLSDSNIKGGSVNPLTEHNHSAPSWDGKQSYYWAWASASTRSNTVRDANSSATAGTYSGGNPLHTIQGSDGQYSRNSGDSTNHNNWQPYLTVYRWRRIA